MSKHLSFLSVNTITFMLPSLFNPKCERNVMPWTAENNEGSNYASCARFCYLKAAISRHLLICLKSLNFFRINWISKIVFKFCYHIRLYLAIETISYYLLLRIARMEMDCNVAQVFQVLMLCCITWSLHVSGKLLTYPSLLTSQKEIKNKDKKWRSPCSFWRHNAHKYGYLA